MVISAGVMGGTSKKCLGSYVDGDYSHAFWADDLDPSLLFIGSCKTGSKQLSSVQVKV